MVEGTSRAALRDGTNRIWARIANFPKIKVNAAIFIQNSSQKTNFRSRTKNGPALRSFKGEVKKSYFQSYICMFNIYLHLHVCKYS